uniref:Glycoside hydrolase family 5 domain-containing protein n=1 Tax=Meloidogyne incognita TaxID=6306 RepID=A0A914L940_MELIC
KEFFTYFASKYGNYTNIIYEPFNEPTTDWKTAKAYHEQIVATIRKYDKNNMITLGTSTWSQDVDIASRDPVNGANLCYTLHVYAATHKQNIRDKAQAALDNNVCIFVSEYGTVDASGGGNMDTGSMNEWWGFWDKNNISYLNWALSNKGEGSAALNPNTVASDVGNPSHWSASGKLVQAHLKNMNNGVSCDGSKGKYPSGQDEIITTKSPSKNKYPSGDEVPSTKSSNTKYPSGDNIIITTKLPSKTNNGKYPSGDQVITTKSPSKTNNGKSPSAPSKNNNNGKYPSGEQNVCIFVSEYGTVDAGGGGNMDTASMNEWWSFWDKNKISYLNWALSNKGEGSAALNPNTVASDVGNPSHWSASGKFVQAHLKNMNNGVSCSGGKQNNAAPSPSNNNNNNGAPIKNNGGTTPKKNGTKTDTTKNNSKGGGKISISLNAEQTWPGGANYKIIVKNTGNAPVCSVTFQIAPVAKVGF